MTVPKNMCVGDLRVKFAAKMNTEVNNLICILKNEKDKVILLEDKHLVEEIDSEVYYTMIYEVETVSEHDAMIEFSFWEDRGKTMRSVDKGVIRFEKVDRSTTMFDLKKQIFKRFGAALGGKVPTEDEDINNGVTLYVEDNMPIIKGVKPSCEFCTKKHTDSKLCFAKANAKSGNNPE